MQHKALAQSKQYHGNELAIGSRMSVQIQHRHDNNILFKLKLPQRGVKMNNIIRMLIQEYVD